MHKLAKKSPRWLKFLVISILSVILIISACLAFLSHDPEGAALFADNVLRPLIGSRSVVALEGMLFGVQDTVNRLDKHEPTKSSYTSNLNTTPLASLPPTITPPANITPFIDTSHPLTGEGNWKQIANTDLFTTFIRTDSERPYAVVNLVYIPMQVTNIAAVAGTKYPGGTLGKPGTGVIPPNIQESGNLVAAFNGGFQEKDGHYGMYAYGVTYVPLKKSLATLFIYQDGHVALLPYDGNPLPADIVVARQNGPMLVANGHTTKNTSQGIDWWAGTAAGGYITWRSGLGISTNGDLIYAVGPSLTPTSLADALRLGGSINAMQLDINNFWVRFMLYGWNSQTNSYTWTTLIKGLADGGKLYLHGNEKDFFYLYKK